MAKWRFGKFLDTYDDGVDDSVKVVEVYKKSAASDFTYEEERKTVEQVLDAILDDLYKLKQV